MGMKSFMVTMGVGMIAGATVALMLPRSNPVRKAAQKAADKMEGVVDKTTDCYCS